MPNLSIKLSSKLVFFLYLIANSCKIQSIYKLEEGYINGDKYGTEFLYIVEKSTSNIQITREKILIK